MWSFLHKNAFEKCGYLENNHRHSYSGSSFATNKTICCYNYEQQNFSELLVGLLIALAPVLPGVEGPLVIFLQIENSLYQQNITFIPTYFFNWQFFSFWKLSPFFFSRLKSNTNNLDFSSTICTRKRWGGNPHVFLVSDYFKGLLHPQSLCPLLALASVPSLSPKESYCRFQNSFSLWGTCHLYNQTIIQYVTRL